MSGDQLPQSRPHIGEQLARRWPLRVAVAGLLGTALFHGSLPDEPSPEAVPVGDARVCWADMDCEDTPMAVYSGGNSIPATDIPELCMRDRNGNATYVVEPADRPGTERETDVDPDVIRAILSSEDREYCNHNGNDWGGVARALYRTITGNRQGGSTITNDFTANLYQQGMSENEYVARLQELAMAPGIEGEFNKTQIMLGYLNNVYFGEGAYGVIAGSIRTLGMPPNNLDPADGSTLAALLVNPDLAGSPDPVRHAHEMERLLVRRNERLEDQGEMGFLSLEQVAHYKAQPMELAPYTFFDPENDEADEAAREETERLHAVQAADVVMSEVSRITGLSLQELIAAQVRVVSTLRYEDHQALVAAMEANPLEDDGRQYAATMIDDSGGVTAYIPGDYVEGGSNPDLLAAPVIAGSEYKILGTVILLQHGFTGQTILPSQSSFTWQNWDGMGNDYRVNGGDRCLGDSCSLDRAMIDSDNVSLPMALADLQRQGFSVIEDTNRLMDELGMTSSEHVGPEIFLGGREEAPIDRALGIGVQIFARQGRSAGLRFSDQIVFPDDRFDDRMYQPGQSSQIIDSEITAEATRIFEGPPREGTARALAELTTETGLIAKTGTGGTDGELASNDTTVVANVLVTFCQDGHNKTVFVMIRQPNSLEPLVPQVAGGGDPTEVARDAIDPLIGQNCDIIDAAQNAP